MNIDLRKLSAFILVGMLLSGISCNQKSQKQTADSNMENYTKGTYGYDLAFLKMHGSPVELVNGSARVLISPRYQGRVMTSTANGAEGKSFGWINYDLIESGETLDQFNPVGGEERFWLGPEGGQFSIFFSKDEPFGFEYWETPAPIDTEPFELNRVTESEAEFIKTMQITNYSDFTFYLDVTRTVKLLLPRQMNEQLGMNLPAGVSAVGYETVNRIQNYGEKPWTKDSGLLSVWLLGMFNPSPSVTVIIPYNRDAETDYIVKDDYFGKISADRLVVQDGIIFFRGDGKQRGKLGIPPQRALPVLGSYDADNKVLTVVKADIPVDKTDYVNSAWEIQENPYSGDVLNSYNDGPLEGGGQLGPFYELESSSPALDLKPGEEAVHSQSTFHFEGSEEELDIICRELFGVTLEHIKTVFSD